METALVSIIMPMYNAGKFYQNLLKAFWNKPIRIGNYYSLMMEVKMILLILHLFYGKRFKNLLLKMNRTWALQRPEIKELKLQRDNILPFR